MDRNARRELCKAALRLARSGPGADTVNVAAQRSPIADSRLALSTSEVARRLGVSVGTVRRWSDTGHLAAYRTPGGQRRYSAEQVDAFVASLERSSGRERL